MADYSKTTDFAAKDALLTGNPAKIVKGTEIDTEFNNIATAIASKLDESGGVLTSPQINDTSSDHQYIVAVNELGADRTITLPLLTGDDEFVFKDHAVTLTNKTLTQPTITLKQAASPTPTAEGDIQWDTDDNAVKIGDGASTQTFHPSPTSTDNAIARFDGTTGKLQDSAVTIDDTTGSLTFTGTSVRIKGDFSNATAADRVAFQSSTTDGATSLNVFPNGTSVVSRVVLTNASDPTNASIFQPSINGTDARLDSNRYGSGTYLPMTFYTSGSERVRIDTNGFVGIGTTPVATWDTVYKALQVGNAYIRTISSNGNSAFGTNIYGDSGGAKYIGNGYAAQVAVNQSNGLLSIQTYATGTAGNALTAAATVTLGQADFVMTTAVGGIGYGTGAGGTATQGSGSGKATAVTLSKPCGTITMNNATLNSGTTVSFTWTNTLIAAADTVVWSQQGGTNGAYTLTFTPGAGTCNVALRNVTAGNLAEAFAFNFTIIKGATS